MAEQCEAMSQGFPCDERRDHDGQHRRRTTLIIGVSYIRGIIFWADDDIDTPEFRADDPERWTQVLGTPDDWLRSAMTRRPLTHG